MAIWIIRPEQLRKRNMETRNGLDFSWWRRHIYWSQSSTIFPVKFCRGPSISRVLGATCFKRGSTSAFQWCFLRKNVVLSIGYPQNHPKLIVDSSFPSKTCHFMGPGPPIRPCWNSRGQVSRVVRACVELGYRARSAGGRTYLLESRSVHRGWGVSIPSGNQLEIH